MKPYIGLLSLLIVLVGCSPSPQQALLEVSSSPQVHQVDPSQDDFVTFKDWTKYSFTDFALSLPEDWRVLEFNQDQAHIVLANYTPSANQTSFDPQTDQHRLRLDIKTQSLNQTLDNFARSQAGSNQLDSITINDQPAFILNPPEPGFTVFTLHPRTRNLHVFHFDYDFDSQPDLAQAILSSISFAATRK